MQPFRTTSSPPACKVCQAATSLFGAVDMNRACGGTPGFSLPPAGVSVTYYRCVDCGLIFTDAFDSWSADEFKERIYNDDYVRIDPDYLEARPAGNARFVDKVFGFARDERRVLDYGGGNGRFSSALQQSGWPRVTTYDPFSDAFQTRPPGRFDLITCFETLEHLPAPAATLADLLSFLDDDGAVLFSTLVQPRGIAEVGMNWWYIGPRNGHMTFFTPRALTLVWAQLGLHCYSYNENLHLAVRGDPPWLRERLGKAPPNPA